MKHTKYLFATFLALATCAAMSSCSDNKNGDEPDPPADKNYQNPNPMAVFPSGVPKSAAGMEISVAPNGLVSEITTPLELVTFDYTPVSRATDYQLVMSVLENGDSRPSKYYMQLNDKGFVKYVREEDEDGDVHKWWFDYNESGQLSYIRSNEGGNEITRITYENGDIVRVTVRETDEETEDLTQISYTDNENPTALANYGGIMLFDEVYDIALDDLEYAYYAGLLGRSTQHLPIKAVENDGDIKLLTWTMNSQNLPETLILEEYNPNSTPITTSTLRFKW